MGISVVVKAMIEYVKLKQESIKIFSCKAITLWKSIWRYIFEINIGYKACKRKWKSRLCHYWKYFIMRLLLKRNIGYWIVNNRWIWSITTKKAGQNFSKKLKIACVQGFCSRGRSYRKIRTCILKRQLNFFFKFFV